MVKPVILATSLASASVLVQGGVSSPVTMQDLTVPDERLPVGCGLTTPPPSQVPPSGVVTITGGGWDGLGITTNPWAGTDRQLITSIRERIEGPPLVPDGPPPTAREASRYRLLLATGVEEGYAAFYTQSGPQEIRVYALRFAVTERAFAFDHRSNTLANAQNITRVEIGPIVAFVYGNDGQCFQAVGAYLKSLAN